MKEVLKFKDWMFFKNEPDVQFKPVEFDNAKEISTVRRIKDGELFYKAGVTDYHKCIEEMQSDFIKGLLTYDDLIAHSGKQSIVLVIRNFENDLIHVHCEIFTVTVTKDGISSESINELKEINDLDKGW
jgi:hypothetical protein